MAELDIRSIRIAVDLQACQTHGSAQRGVGRYSRSLFLEMSRMAGRREFFGLAGTHLPFPVSWPEISEQRMIRSPELPDWGSARSFDGGEQDALDAAVYASVVASALPDVVHVSHIFEGYGDRVALPGVKSRPFGQVFSATLYDLIPMRFSDHYFRDSRFKAWYLQRAQLLRQADLLLAISESSRQDAINFLGLDPSRIVTIYGGISDHFVPVADVGATRARIITRYKITRPRFILYTGGDDHRKNLQGAIDGYAALPRDARQNTQLIVVCALQPDRKKMFENAARQAGLDKDDIIFVGYVPEEDLIGLYATCDLFVFPSLYEGLGLPVLEAMACGAPVIGGENSSIRELIGRPDAMFNASKPESIGEAMYRVLTNPGLTDELRQYGLKRVTHFNWHSAAELAVEAFDEAVRRKREAGVCAAGAGWLKRGRLAVLTPLPPARSGIADYNAQFLPFLAEHFEIDLYIEGSKVADAELSAAFRIFDVADFPANAHGYDAILYEFGNSEFHAHMLPLLERYPGVVGLHDAYLSGLIGYLDFNLGQTNHYPQAMLESHGNAARRAFAPVFKTPDPVGKTMVNMPGTKTVLNQATGVISHSPFNLDTAREFYPEGWRAPYRIIPQMVVVPEAWSEARRNDARAALGFRPNDIVIATFGHVAWTKCGDRLLDAVENSALATESNCHLIFVGELAKDDFGFTLGSRVKKSKLEGRVQVTGFISDEEYATYMHIADIAVQLRTKSRGGTPKGVLDCLANGLPVVVNAEASYKDYPDDVVIKLGADPDAAEIAQTLITLSQSGERRRTFAQAGLNHVRVHHDPRLCAQEYAAAISEFTALHVATKVNTLAKDIAPHLAATHAPSQAAELVAAFVRSIKAPSFLRPRLLIDVSHISNGNRETDIARIVRNAVQAAYLSVGPGQDVVAIRGEQNNAVPANVWLQQQGLALLFETAATTQPIKFRAGDHLLMLDSHWAAYDQFTAIFRSARAAHVPVTTVIYDLMPINLPATEIVAGGKTWFEGWIRSAIAESDNLLCVSRSLADEVISYIKQHNLGKPGLQVGYWRLGSEDPIGATASASPAGITLPYALMIGAIEPRKNHDIALRAFEILWDKGIRLSLVIAGREGWLAGDLMKKLRAHRALGKMLFVIEGPDDAKRAELYRHAKVTLFLSKGEGFGLPLVEAASYGAPILCSDIPVFREIAEQHATFVTINEPAELARDIQNWLACFANNTAPASTGLKRLTWEESAKSLMQVVIGHQWYWNWDDAKSHRSRSTAEVMLRSPA